MKCVGINLYSVNIGVDDMLRNKDEQALLKMIDDQILYDIDYIGINSGVRLEEEMEDVLWMVRVIQDHYSYPLVIDTLNANVMREALKIHRHGKPIMNSTSGDDYRMHSYFPLAKEFGCSVIALTMDEAGIPTGVPERLRVAHKLVETGAGYGLKPEDIYLDPCAFAVSVDSNNCVDVCSAIAALKKEFPDNPVSICTTNMSYGLPEREILDIVGMSMAVASGLDMFLTEITPAVGAALQGLKLMNGQDDYSEQYIKRYREKRLDIFSKKDQIRDD